MSQMWYNKQESKQDNKQDERLLYMDKYTPPFDITNKMLYFVSSISEKIGNIDYQHNFESKPHLRRNNKIRSIHSSLRIEANSLSLGQVRDIIDGHLVLGEQKEIQEVKNAYEAYEQIGKINPYSINDLNSLHAVMTKYLVSESGVFRSGEEGVFNGDECIFMAPPAQLVPDLMKQLFDWMNREKNYVHPLILSAVFHYEFVFIHPYSDGNGRMARLWHTAILSKWKPIFEFIPIESQIEKFQDGYYEVIAKCHTDGKSNVFIEFMLEQIDSILDEIITLLKSNTEMLSSYVIKMLDVMDYGVPYSANQIMEKLKLKSKETFRKNYMNPALEIGVVKMTIPDKPNSKNQRYIKQ